MSASDSPTYRRSLTALAAAWQAIEENPNRDTKVAMERSIGVNASPQLMVKTFHELYGMPVAHRPTQLSVSRRHLRLMLILEELDELITASGFKLRISDVAVGGQRGIVVDHVEGSRQDMVEMADGLADIVYVCYGMALEMGVDLQAVLREVHAANLTKLSADGTPIINECQHYGGDKQPPISFGTEAVSDSMGVCHLRERTNDCDNQSHFIDPRLPKGKVLKGPNYVKANIARVLGLNNYEEEK